MRKLNIYEYNQLLKHNLKKIDISEYGEMPIEYITGYAEFYNKEFYVNKDVLIPRIETEELINYSLNFLNKKESLIIADIGTGSGIIGITLSLELKKINKEFELYLSDISTEALNIAEKNLLKFNLKTDNIHIIKSDLLKDYPNIKLDLITANLPYIPETRKVNLQKSVADFEPHLALFGGNDGMYLIRNLIKQIIEKDMLKENGLLILEIDDSHEFKNFEEFSSLFSIEIKKDLNNKNRFAFLKRI